MTSKRDPRREIWGYVPAVVSHFNPAGDLLIERFAEVVRWHLDRGADGICVAGDNGEAWSLTADDRRRLAETAVGVVGGRVHVTMGASATTARQTIENAEIAAEGGVDSLMITPQAYVMKATPTEVLRRYKAINKAVPLPILLYNSPRRTGGVNVDIDLLGALCDALPVIGLKESSRDFFTPEPRHPSFRRAHLRSRRSRPLRLSRPGARRHRLPGDGGGVPGRCRPPHPAPGRRRALRRGPRSAPRADHGLRNPDGNRHLAGGVEGGVEHDRRSRRRAARAGGTAAASRLAETAGRTRGPRPASRQPGDGRGGRRIAPCPHLRRGGRTRYTTLS